MDQAIDQESSGKTMAFFILTVSTEVALEILCWSVSTQVGDCLELLASFSEFIATLLPKDLAVVTTLNLNSAYLNLLLSHNSVAEINEGNLARIIVWINLALNWNPDDLDTKESLITINIQRNTGMHEITNLCPCLILILHTGLEEQTFHIMQILKFLVRHTTSISIWLLGNQDLISIK